MLPRKIDIRITKELYSRTRLVVTNAENLSVRKPDKNVTRLLCVIDVQRLKRHIKGSERRRGV